jgi:hypothetical protein
MNATKKSHINRDECSPEMNHARLLTASTAALYRVTHQGRSFDLTQTHLDSCCLEFVSTWRGHLNVCGHGQVMVISVDFD